MLIVERADPLSPGPKAILEASHAMMREMFEPEENYFLDFEALRGDDVRFFAAREGSETLGTGALALKDGYGEVKSMFTADAARGKGVAAAILRALEDEARGLGLPLLRLETADSLDAAVRLYERNGFSRREIFGDYRPNANSVYMEKPLEQA
ncbi:MAG: GNAT family N-acetyltransferase [Roseovarius sp.]